MKRFVEGLDRSQVTFLPECLEDFVGDENAVRVALDRCGVDFQQLSGG